jgi:hypothetical protein
MPTIILLGKAEYLWRVGSAITAMIAMKPPLRLKILGFFKSATEEGQLSEHRTIATCPSDRWWLVAPDQESATH